LNLRIIALFSLGLINLREGYVVLRVLRNITVLFRVLFFGSQSILRLFMTFELVRLPVILIVHYYGIQPEKIRAVYYMIVYTGVFGISFLYVIMTLESLRFYISPLLSVFAVGLFLVKSPLWGLHLWLPKAHVEAPTTGSMLLAGLLLKVGLYGILKVSRWRGINPSWVLLLATVGYLVGPVASLTSRDTKQLVAYSSVRHINLVISGIMLVAPRLFTRSYLVALSHGYVSTLVFYAMGEMSHGRGTRIVFYASGVSRVSRLLAVTYSLALLANAGIPPYLSF
jgi:NADH-ubiquinone oxidoreductase chain 4